MKFRKASFWRRLVAYIFDGLILANPSVVMWFFEEDIFHLSQGAFYVYAILMEANFQKTFGKRIMGLKVIRINGRKPNLANCFWRNIGKIISTIPYCYGFLRILAPHHVQTIHDELARCLVVCDD